MNHHVGEEVSQAECPDFIFRLPFTVDQQDSAIKQRAAQVQRDLAYIRQHGYDEFEAQFTSNDDTGVDDMEVENLGDKFEGTLRNYQVHLLEKCKRENVVVHLATGMGKTMISIMLIREYLSKRQTTIASGQEGLVTRHGNSKRQILFLVPSIALCVQHSDTLRANLNCSVATACHTSSHTARSRDEISRSDVIVATHGTAKDLLQHYPDVLALSNLDLMVIDEAHYAGTKDHNYATIMKLFYHTLPVGERPHVLGLTASPLINAKVTDTAERLRMKLSDFERTLDSKLHGFPDELAFQKETKESIVYFDSLLDSFSTKLPEPDMTLLHKSRGKELRQLQALCNDVGLKVTSTYITALLREIGRNEYDHETIEQFNELKVYLSRVAVNLNRQVDEGHCGDFSGHTEKMSTLVGLLVDLLKRDDPVGVIFVERRITAIALSHYFNHDKPLEPLGVDIRSDSLVRSAQKIFKYLNNGSSSHDQQVIEQDFLHQTKRIRSVINKLRTRETNVLIATSVVEEGVDVEACSFIISFDRMKVIRSAPTLTNSNSLTVLFVDHQILHSNEGKG